MNEIGANMKQHQAIQCVDEINDKIEYIRNMDNSLFSYSNCLNARCASCVAIIWRALN